MAPLRRSVVGGTFIFLSPKVFGVSFMLRTPVFDFDSFFFSFVFGEGKDSSSNRVATSCGENFDPSGNNSLFNNFSESASDSTFSCLFSSIMSWMFLCCLLSISETSFLIPGTW